MNLLNNFSHFISVTLSSQNVIRSLTRFFETSHLFCYLYYACGDLPALLWFFKQCYGLSALLWFISTVVYQHCYGVSAMVWFINTVMVYQHCYGLSALLWSINTAMVYHHCYGLSALLWFISTVMVWKHLCNAARFYLAKTCHLSVQGLRTHPECCTDCDLEEGSLAKQFKAMALFTDHTLEFFKQCSVTF